MLAWSLHVDLLCFKPSFYLLRSDKMGRVQGGMAVDLSLCFIRSSRPLSQPSGISVLLRGNCCESIATKTKQLSHELFCPSPSCPLLLLPHLPLPLHFLITRWLKTSLSEWDCCPLNASEDCSPEDIILEADRERPGARTAVWKSRSQYNNQEDSSLGLLDQTQTSH